MSKLIREAEGWKLPDTLKSLHQVSEQLAQQLATQEMVETLRQENTKLKESVHRLETELEQARKQYETAMTTEKQRYESVIATEKPKHDAELKEATKTIADLKTVVATLQAEVRKAVMEFESKEVSKGGTIELVRNDLSLGVKEIYSSWVVVKLNKKEERLEPSDSLTFNRGGRTYIITLRNIAYESNPSKCTFSVGSYESESVSN